MKKSLLLLSFFMGSFLPLFSQAKIQFEDLYHDFGSVIEGEKPAYLFQFSNSGDEALVLTSVQPSCGCTSPFWSKDTVLPGQKGEINVQYNSTRRLGVFKKSIRIQSNAANNVDIIKIYGVVSNPGSDTLDTADDFAPKIQIEIKDYTLGEIELQKEYKIKVLVKNVGAQSLDIGNVQAGCGCVREMAKISIAPDEQKELVIAVKARQEGAITIKAVIGTNDPASRYKVINVSFVGRKFTQDNMMFSKPGTGF